MQYNAETDDARRNAEGRCVECRPGEQGYLLGPISDAEYASWEGYAGSDAASARKVIRGVFSENDRWFRSGDVLSRDSEGYYFFGDRVGYGSFRWKGELVSAVEVQTAVLDCPNAMVVDACAYGVPVPNQDGAAGMVALCPGNGPLAASDLERMLAHFDEQLPSYAVPVFLRECITGVPVNDSMKHKVKVLAEQGWELHGAGPASTDRVWVLDPGRDRSARRGYRPFSVNTIHAGDIRL